MPIQRKGSFADRFTGRTSTINKEADLGITATINRPIQKLSDTNSSLYSHLHTTAQAYSGI